MERDNHGAASSVVSFLIAGVLFTAGVGAVLLAGQQTGKTFANENEAELKQARAGGLLSILLASPGSADGGVDWIDNPDQLVRLGLRDANGLHLNFTKFQNLRLAKLATDPADGRINYGEALTSLGLSDEGLDFHIRAYPSLGSVREILGTGIRDPNMRVTYLGHQDSTSSGTGGIDAGLTVSTPTCTVSGDDFVLATDVGNGGTQSATFQVRFHLTAGATVISESVHGFVTPVGTTHTFEVRVPNAGGARCNAGDSLEAEVWDSQKLITTRDITFASTAGTPTVAPRVLLVNPANLHVPPGAAANIEYGGTLVENDALVLKVYKAPGDVTGTLVHTANIVVPKQAHKWDVDVPAAALTGESQFHVTVQDAAGTLVKDRLLVASSIQPFSPTGGSVTTSWADSVGPEIAFLNSLVEQFCPADWDNGGTSALTGWGTGKLTHAERCAGWQTGQDRSGDAVAQPGDVFPDEKGVVNDELRWRLWDDATNKPRYDLVNTLVVGSDVAHNSLTSNAIKEPLGNWVTGGGTLIVFGHDSKNVQWMQSIFHAGIEPSSGGVSTPDGDHPLLQVTDTLDYAAYDNHDKAWKFNQASAKLFTNVVVQDGEPILAVSKPGAFQQGNIVLTTWLPYDLFGTGDDPGQEGFKVVNNMLMQGYRDLFLDYGPPLPEGGRNVLPGVRVASIIHPDFDEPIQLTITVYVF